MVRVDKGLDLLPRLLPFSEEAERAILGGLLLEPDAIDEIQERLKAEHFYQERHSLLFGAMLAIKDAGITPDFRTIQARLEQAGKWDVIGGLAYLASLDIDLPAGGIGNLVAYADIVRERWRARMVIQRCSQSMAEAMNGEAPLQVIGTLTGDLDKLIQSTEGDGFKPITDALEAAFAMIDEGPPRGAVRTGLPGVDKLIRWLRDGRVYLLGGRAKSGKTALALGIARYNASPERGTIGIVSLEMDRLELAQRLLSMEARVSYERMAEGTLTAEESRQIIEAYRRLGKLRIQIDDESAELQTIVSRCRRLKHQFPDLRLVVIDYLGLIEGPKKENRQNEVAAISRRLVQLAKELGVPLLVLVQLNRDADNRQPRAADMKDSGAQEADAYAVLLCWRKNDDRGFPGSEGEVIVDLHRAGPTGPVELKFFGEFMKWQEIDTTHAWDMR